VILLRLVVKELPKMGFLADSYDRLRRRAHFWSLRFHPQLSRTAEWTSVMAVTDVCDEEGSGLKADCALGG